MIDNDKHNITYEYISRYINSTVKVDVPPAIKAYAQANAVPIALPETIALLRQMTLATGARSVLEIGTAIGYTASHFASCGAKVVTIEKEPQLAAVAQEFTSGKDITIHTGDALELLPTISGTFDIIFLDAQKGSYLEYLPLLMPKLRVGGILISDNVLYKGMVATDDLVIRRKITIVKRLRQYLHTICNMDGCESCILPVGDGVAITTKLKETT